MTPYLSPAARARAFPFALFMALLALRGYWPDSLAMDTRWLYGASVVGVGALLHFYWQNYGELARQMFTQGDCGGWLSPGRVVVLAIAWCGGTGK